MTVNLRVSLTVFKVGFAVEAAGGFAALFTQSSQLPLRGYLLLLSPAFSVVGILFLWVGRHELHELHRTRVGYATGAFVVSLLAIALAAAPVAYLVLVGGPAPPSWLQFEFGVAIAMIFGTTFVMYVFVAGHLAGRAGTVAIWAGLAWSLIVSALIGLALASQLFPIVHDVVVRSIAVNSIAHPITFLTGLLSLSYVAFFVGFAEAHYRVAKGVVSPTG